jgi:hypothetical protein
MSPRYHTAEHPLTSLILGANDAVLPEAQTGQHVPLETYTSNLNTIITNLVSDTSEYPFVPNLILITPPPLYPGMMDDPAFAAQRTVEGSNRYRQACLDVGREWQGKEGYGKEWKLGVVDLWGAMVDDAGGMDEKLRPYFK